MIANKDRSDWFGASDTERIMSSWTSKTFERWWMNKLGVDTSTFATRYTLAGTHWEHRILEYIGIEETDRQIIIPEYCLRINLDGEKIDTVYECKTFINERGYDLPKAHRRQTQVQMWGAKKQGVVVSYGLLNEDYDNYFRDIDDTRLMLHPIQQDEDFIEQYLHRLSYLAKCLNEGVFPKEKNL